MVVGSLAKIIVCLAGPGFRDGLGVSTLAVGSAGFALMDGGARIRDFAEFDWSNHFRRGCFGYFITTRSYSGGYNQEVKG